MIRAASFYCDLNTVTSRTIVGRIFHFSSSNCTPLYKKVWFGCTIELILVDGPRKIFRWTLYIKAEIAFSHQPMMFQIRVNKLCHESDVADIDGVGVQIGI